MAALAAALLVGACQAAAPERVVYTAPPDVLFHRASFAPSAAADDSSSADPSAGPSPAPVAPSSSGAASSAASSGVASGGPSASAAASAGTSGAGSAATSEAPSDVASGGPSASARIGIPARGQILFGTGVGTETCSVLNPSAVLSSSDPFFFAAYLKDHQDGTKAVTLHIERNGVTLTDHAEKPDGKPYDCYGNTSAIAGVAPGSYHFQVLLGTTVEADGSVTVR